MREYLKDNPDIMKYVRHYAPNVNPKMRHSAFDPAECENILNKLECISPLQDLEASFQEAQAKEDGDEETEFEYKGLFDDDP